MSVPTNADAARRHRWALVLLWVIPALWSSNYIIARAAAGVVPPHVLAFGRWLLAFALFLPMTFGILKDTFPQWRGEWRQMLVLGALGMWICGAYVYVAGHTTSATNIGLIYATTPVGIAVVSSRMSKVGIPAAHWAGMLLALAGVVFVVARGDLDVLLSVRFTAGDLWVVFTSVSWVAYSVLNTHWRSALGPAPRLTCITAGGLLILLPFAVWEVASQHYVPGGKAWLLIAAAGLLPGFLSYLAYSFMLRELGAPKAALQTYLSPIYAAFSAWWLLDEPPHWYHLVGGALILPSIYFATRQRKIG
jgi:drug/metabolite transporter (DMT)-like permease